MKRQEPKYRMLIKKEDVDGFAKAAKRYFKQLYEPLIKPYMEHFVNRKGLSLDLGCGPGVLADYFSAHSELDVETVGIDLSREMIKRASDLQGRRYNLHLCQADAYKLPFQREAFDVIYSSLGLHHWQDPKSILKEVKRVLKPDGLFILRDVKRCNGWLIYCLIWLLSSTLEPFAKKSIRRSVRAGYTKKEVADLLKMMEGEIRISESFLFVDAIVCRRGCENVNLQPEFCTRRM